MNLDFENGKISIITSDVHFSRTNVTSPLLILTDFSEIEKLSSPPKKPLILELDSEEESSIADKQLEEIKKYSKSVQLIYPSTVPIDSKSEDNP
jgi:hypothetical protein